jgi:hypothetical protein
MFTLELIEQMNREAAVRARNLDIQPYLIASTDCLNEVFESWRPLPFPSIGDADEDFDKIFKRIDTLFCDSSGFGASNEPALTREQLHVKLADIIKEHGSIYVAITETGQFQLYLGVWK